MKHDIIKTGDPDAHPATMDRNGEVVLAVCRCCGQAEGELEETCHRPPERNQCDGCRVKAPLTMYGNHVYPDGSMMGCTKGRYT